jgi:transposase-like protein
MLDGSGKCEECFAKRIEAPAQPAEKETAVGAKSKVDWTAAQNDRSSGMAVAEIAKKFGVSEASIYTRTRGARRKVRGGGAVQQKAPREAGRPRADAGTNGSFDAVLADLRERREKLDRAIGAIEELSQ